MSIVPRGESYYQKMMESMVKELDQAGLLELDDGRKVRKYELYFNCN